MRGREEESGRWGDGARENSIEEKRMYLVLKSILKP